MNGRGARLYTVGGDGATAVREEMLALRMEELYDMERGRTGRAVPVPATCLLEASVARPAVSEADDEAEGGRASAVTAMECEGRCLGAASCGSGCSSPAERQRAMTARDDATA